MRWKTVTCFAFGAISGVNWKALAPVPITAMRLPASSTSARQRAEWKAGPANVSSPSMSGSRGQLNRPRYPDVEGRETFEGPSFHSAEWRHDVDLTGDDTEAHLAVRLRALEARITASPAVAGTVLSLSAPDEPTLVS